VDVTALDLRSPEAGLDGALVVDLREPGALEPFLTARTTVFHMAASADVARSVADPRQDFQTTLECTFETLEAARKAGARVVFPSTASIFDGRDELPLDERAFVRPASPYAAAKVAAEAYCFAYHRCYGLDVRIARMFSVYGIGMTRFAIYDIVSRVMADPPRLLILGDGNQVRDYLYIDDAVRGLALIGEVGSAGEDYNLGSGEPVRIADLARKILRLMGREDLQVAPSGTSFPGDVNRFYADTTKVRRLGFSPRVGLDEGLSRTIEWIKQNAKEVRGLSDV